jgi:hypothetical protein
MPILALRHPKISSRAQTLNPFSFQKKLDLESISISR